MLETKVRRAAATKNDDPEHQPTTKLQHHQSIATRPGMHSNAATTTASSMKMDEKWTIGGPSSKNVPQPTLNGGGDWMVLGKQLQRMVSLRLQDAEAKAHDDELRYQPPRLPADQMDMFGREPLTDGLDLVVCNHCAKPVLASRFCAHLERCPRMPDLSFTPPGSELSQNKRKSAAHPAKAAAAAKKAKLQEELLNNGSNTTTTSTKAGGAKPKLSKAKAAGAAAAAADSSNAQVKRPKARAGGGAKDGKTNGVEQEKLKIRISLKDKSKDAAATDKKPPENGEKSKEKEKAKDKDREKEGAGKERAGKKERATKIVVVDLLQPLPLATRTYVRRNKLRCLALTFLSPPPSQTPIDHPATSPLLGAAGAANASYAAAQQQQQQRASPSMTMMSSAAASHGVSASPYPYAHHPASSTSSSPSPTMTSASSSALGSSPSYMHNPSASPSSSAAATAAAAMAGHNGGMTNGGGGMMVGGANGYNLNSIMQSVGKKGSGTHSVTISPNALKMYQAKQKMAMMMAAQQAAAAAAANGMNMSGGDSSAMAGGGEQGFIPAQPHHASVTGQSGPYM